MSELLVMAIDRVDPDPYIHATCYKRGDVVVAMPDGWGWGTLEGPPTFQVVKVPDLPLTDAQALTAEERPSDPSQRSRTLQRRQARLNLDALTPPYTAEQIRAATIIKAPIPDPAILGPSSGVFG